MTTRGVLFVHSAPPGLRGHVERAVAAVLGTRVVLQWTAQPASPGTWRTELTWHGHAALASRLTSALRGWRSLRYEVTAEPAAGVEGERYSSTPDLGLFHAVTGPHGDILVPEDRLRAALASSGRNTSRLEEELARLLGTAWDEELEPFRHAGAYLPLRRLHPVV